MTALFKINAIILVSLFSAGLISCFGGNQPSPISPGATPTTDTTITRKISTLLLRQIELRQKQLEQPTGGRGEQMEKMGMSLDNLSLQKVFIHLTELPSEGEIQGLHTTGITLYVDSWIPPVGNFPTGFLLAEMPIERLMDLASKDYVVRLETAETASQPQSRQ